MFICQKCSYSQGLWGLSQSFGPCESCGTTTGCFDIPSAQVLQKKSDLADQAAMELRRLVKLARRERAAQACGDDAESDRIAAEMVGSYRALPDPLALMVTMLAVLAVEQAEYERSQAEG